jgi:putative nucleotidyltransferase with HDIG domain
LRADSSSAPTARWSPDDGPCRAAAFLEEAKSHERDGRPADALRCYREAAQAAHASGEQRIEAEVLRRLAVVHHHRNDPVLARELVRRSFAIARAIGDDVLAGEALNVLAAFDFEAGAMDQARARYLEALQLSAGSSSLRGRVEQNLGILANTQGDHDLASTHYARSLAAFESSGDEKGRAIAYHNLGMVSADRRRWDDADTYFRSALQLARALGDVHLTGLCLLNHSEVHLARQRFEEARHNAETALAIFDQLGTRLDKADAYKVLGVVYRETGRQALAESRFRTAIELAVSTGSVLGEAEASRELARLYQGMGRNQEALQLLNSAHRLFTRIDARVDLVDVASKVHRLEDTYFAVVREWGQSIESSDSYTFGHCERVAQYGMAVARAMKLDEVQLTTIRMGAYLHDLGKVRVPHEILNKPGALTPQEFEIIKQHPVWGIDLLATVEFPWDIKPIIRSHHERYDGTGYPDGLRGEAIPLGAQIICIVDVYDALTTTRSYREALPPADAITRMEASRGWWRPDVYQAFRSALVEAAAAA